VLVAVDLVAELDKRVGGVTMGGVSRGTLGVEDCLPELWEVSDWEVCIVSQVNVCGELTLATGPGVEVPGSTLVTVVSVGLFTLGAILLTLWFTGLLPL